MSVEEKKLKESEGPKDKSIKLGVGAFSIELKLNYIIFYWLGIGTLLPWNMFISVGAYWVSKFATPQNSSSPVAEEEMPLACEGNATEWKMNPLQESWFGYMAVASMVPNVTFLMLNAAFGHLLKTQPRLLVSLFMVIISFIFTTVMVEVNTDSWQEAFLYVTLASVVFININAAIFQGGLLGIAGRFPPEYMGAVFGGQAIGGIFASGTNVVVLSMGATPTQSAFFCFLISVVFLLSSLAVYAVATRTDFYKHCSGEGVVQDLEKKPEDSKLLDEHQIPEVRIPIKINPIITLTKIWPYVIAVTMCFLVTLGCFPAIAVLVQSTTCDKTHEKFFVPIACFLLFNIGDYVGRFLAGLIQWPKPGKFGAFLCLFFSFARFAFLVLFLLCNVKPSGRVHTSVVFYSDAAYILIMLLFSTTNGYLGSICMISAPQLTSSGTEAQTASSIMVAMLGLGLGSGAALSNIFVKLL